MSYNIEGKVANQHPRGGVLSKVRCGKCNKTVYQPSIARIKIENSSYNIYHYVKQDYFIYETKSGRSIVYCSEYCRNKHNHRYSR